MERSNSTDYESSKLIPETACPELDGTTEETKRVNLAGFIREANDILRECDKLGQVDSRLINMRVTL